MKRWEYEIVEGWCTSSGAKEISEDKLNAMGKDGWELISCSWDNNKLMRAVFKRPAWSST